MPHKSKATWLLVADGATAQIYVVTFAPLHLTKMDGGAFKGSKARTRDLESDRPGVSFESVGGARHTIERHSNAHQRQEDKFAARVADHINAAAEANEFNRLVIAAPPRALAELRKDLGHHARERVWVEVPDEWTKLGALDLLDHVRNHLPIAADA